MGCPFTTQESSSTNGSKMPEAVVSAGSSCSLRIRSLEAPAFVGMCITPTASMNLITASVTVLAPSLSMRDVSLA